MDAVTEIKARLSIDQVVGRYCQLQKKGRHFQCLCPFHKDNHPSFLVSPDKGIAFCFACQNGGDIFSFYQKIEGVDFPQALKDLAEMAGVQLPEKTGRGVPKEEKDRLRQCTQAAHQFFQEQLRTSAKAQEYLRKRGIPEEQWATFGLGLAPDSFSATSDALLKKDFSRTEILAAGLAIQRDLRDGGMYDRFRNRLMFPIHDIQGNVIAFGGRTLGDDDAKYINSSESPLYRKSQVLYGLHMAKEAMREQKRVILVEGYFDLLACHRVGVQNVVAVSGTALTEEHVQILKRTVETVDLCLDSDAAGMDAAERSFMLLSKQGLLVRVIRLKEKDPDEAATANAAALRTTLEGSATPYLDAVIERLQAMDLSVPELKRAALRRILGLLAAVPSAVERESVMTKAAGVFGTSPSALAEDFRTLSTQASPSSARKPEQDSTHDSPFTKTEIALCLFLLYPQLRFLLSELLPPEEGLAAALYQALKDATAEQLTIMDLNLAEEHREKASILALFGEHHHFMDWSEALAAKEIRKNCAASNRDVIHRKQEEITKKLLAAKAEGRSDEESLLLLQYQEVLKLAKMAG